MADLIISNKLLEKYFSLLNGFDIKSKKQLISKLTASMENSSKNNSKLDELFGAWMDTRDSDEIISEIRAARIEKQSTEF